MNQMAEPAGRAGAITRSVTIRNQRGLHARAAAKFVKLADLFEYVCPRKECRERQDGVLLRPDGLHYEGGGGAIVARWLIDQVR